MVDLELLASGSSTEEVVNNTQRALKAFANDALRADLKIAVTTGGSGITAQLCGSLFLPTIPWNQQNFEACQEKLRYVYQSVIWDYWAPQMYDANMNNNADFAGANVIWSSFPPDRIVPVVGIRQSVAIGAIDANAVWQELNKEYTSYPPSPGYTFLQHKSINGLIGFECTYASGCPAVMT